ncbi:acyltransferase [Comamonadaceae bacterium G21597-S1]|nr:acyltransferase [Comamonadaceae bacterium G21597-S1]
MNRRHDIDTLRCLAFGLVILYHIAMPYVADWHWHLKSPHAAAWLQWPMRALNLWRMDLVFLISGLAMGFLLRQPDRLAVLRQRSWRLLLPLAWGMAVVVPYQAYAQAVANGSIAPGPGAFVLRYVSFGPWPPGAFDGSDFGVTWNHLWYLPYLWTYTAVLLVLAPVLGRARPQFQALRGSRLVLLPALPLMLYSSTLLPHFPPTHDLVQDAWLHAVYFTVFVYGWWIGLDAGLWSEILRLRHSCLALACAAFATCMGLRSGWLDGAAAMVAGRLAGDLYGWTMMLSILGFAYRHLNRPWRWLGWARESVYPWYVLHQTLIIVALVWLTPLNLGPVREPLLVLLSTVAGCWLLCDGWIRPSRWLRPLFGLAPLPQQASTGYRPRDPAAARMAAEPTPPRLP